MSCETITNLTARTQKLRNTITRLHSRASPLPPPALPSPPPPIRSPIGPKIQDFYPIIGPWGVTSQPAPAATLAPSPPTPTLATIAIMTARIRSMREDVAGMFVPRDGRESAASALRRQIKEERHLRYLRHGPVGGDWEKEESRLKEGSAEKGVRGRYCNGRLWHW